MNSGDQATGSPSFRVSLELTTLGTKVTTSLRVQINSAAGGGQQAIAAAISSESKMDEDLFFFNFPSGPCEINLDPTPTAGPISDAYIVTGKVNSDRQACFVLFDRELNVFAISSLAKGTSIALPSVPIMLGEEPLTAAIRAFDIFAGTSLRKGCDGCSPSRWAL